MALFLRSRLFQTSVAMLLGSMAMGIVSPVLAADSVTERLASEGIDRDALDVALHEAAESGSTAAVAEVVSSALGLEQQSPETVLHALFGHLYHFLQFQQGPKATVASAASGVSISADSGVGFLASRPGISPPGSISTAATTSQFDQVDSLPRTLRPAVQPLGP